MSELRQNGIFWYLRGYFKKVALGNVKVELFRPNLVRVNMHNEAFHVRQNELYPYLVCL